MQWLNTIVDELIARHPEGEIIVSSGVSPSGPYHLGTLREVLTAEVITNEVRDRGRQAKHLHICDDLDVFRKVPANIPESYKKYLGVPLCDIPSPEDPNKSYADYYTEDFLEAGKSLNLTAEVIRAHQKYREGYFTDAIEIALENIDKLKKILEEISGHKVDDNWSPIQVVEDGYIKNRVFKSINKDSKTLIYIDQNGQEKETKYDSGLVKLNWRIDWPARWWKMSVMAEPFGRDHATKGGSYDTGEVIVKEVYGTEAPLPMPYHFINRTGDTKKMSKSAGDTVTTSDLLEIMPPEVLWYFILRSAPSKQLFFDEGQSLIRLIDDFGELLAKQDKTESDNQLIRHCMRGVSEPTISRVPFSLLSESYQAALKDADEAVKIIARTEYHEVAIKDAETIKRELKFIDAWLNKHAPEEVKFSLRDTIKSDDFSDQQKDFMSKLADKISEAPKDADGEWYHLAIYELKDSTGLSPKELFSTLYQSIIGKQSGPRAGWFLSILDREWLINRLRLAA